MPTNILIFKYKGNSNLDFHMGTIYIHFFKAITTTIFNKPILNPQPHIISLSIIFLFLHPLTITNTHSPSLSDSLTHTHSLKSAPTRPTFTLTTLLNQFQCARQDKHSLAYAPTHTHHIIIDK